MTSPSSAVAVTPVTPLWALAPEYAAVLAEVMEADGDVSDEDLAARLDAIEGAFGDKVERCQLVHRHMSGDAAACRAFVEQLMKPYVERALRLEKMAERLKHYVQAAMITAGKDRVETPLGGARLQKNPKDTVEFAGDPRSLPAAFQRITVEIDKDAVIAANAKGEAMPESVTVKRNRHLRWI